MLAARRLWGASAVLVLGGLLAEWAALQRAPLQAGLTAADIRRAVADVLVGWVVGGCGLTAWRLRPGRPLGPLLVATAVAWFLGTVSGSGVGWVASIGSALVLLHRGPLVHAVISCPDSRGAGRLGGLAIATGYVLVIPALGGSKAGVIVLGALAISAIARRLLRASARDRLALYPPLTIAVVLEATLLVGALIAYEIVVAGSAVWLLCDLLRGRWTDAAVERLVLELGRDPTRVPLERRLADALGDPTVRVVYRLDGRDGFIDASGRTVAPPAGHDRRRVTYLRGSGPAAAIVHDPGVVSDAELLDSVAAVARIAVSNAQLHASVGERLDELVASRRRIVESADLERLRLERRIRLGPQARLDEVRRALTGCAGSDHQPEFAALLVEAVAEVDRAIAELGEFAAGVRPRVLSERGLGPGVTELAGRIPIPVRVVAPDARFPPAVEAVGYFICAEGLANIGKHAAASSAAVEVTASRSSIVVAISDDGRGVAAGVEGSGLTGLRDRVEALGGVLTVRSAPGAGTRLQAVLPLVHS